MPATADVTVATLAIGALGLTIAVFAAFVRAAVEMIWRVREMQKRQVGLPEPASRPTTGTIAPPRVIPAKLAPTIAAPPPHQPDLEQPLEIGRVDDLAAAIAAIAPTGHAAAQLDGVLLDLARWAGWVYMRDVPIAGVTVPRLLIAPPGLYVIEPAVAWTMADVRRVAQHAAAVAEHAAIEPGGVTAVLALGNLDDPPRRWFDANGSGAVVIGVDALGSWLLEQPRLLDVVALRALLTAAGGRNTAELRRAPATGYG